MHVRAVCPTRGPTGQREKRERDKQEEKESRASTAKGEAKGRPLFLLQAWWGEEVGRSLSRALSLTLCKFLFTPRVLRP